MSVLVRDCDLLSLSEAQKLTKAVFYSPKMGMAISVYQAVSTNNYVRFFRLLESADLILSCLLHRFIVSMRLRGFDVLNKAYMANKGQDHQLPLTTVTRQLKFDGPDEALEFCEMIGQKWVATNPDNPAIVLQPINSEFFRIPELVRKSNMVGVYTVPLISAETTRDQPGPLFTLFELLRPIKLISPSSIPSYPT